MTSAGDHAEASCLQCRRVVRITREGRLRAHVRATGQGRCSASGKAACEFAVSWAAWIHLDGWAGRTRDAVVVVGETATRYRITPAGADPVRLAGRRRSVTRGDTALVPKYAVTPRRIELRRATNDARSACASHDDA